MNQEPQVASLVVVGKLLELCELAGGQVVSHQVCLHLLLGARWVSCVIERLGAVLAGEFLYDLGAARVLAIELGEVVDLAVDEDPHVVGETRITYAVVQSQLFLRYHPLLSVRHLLKINLYI